MNTIRIHKHIDSETLHVPELRPMIGLDVEITVVESGLSRSAGRVFWQSRTLDDLAAEQGYVARTFDDLKGTFTTADFQGFDEFLEGIRQPLPRPELD